MRKGNLFILLLAIVMGLVAAYMASNWIAEHTTRTTEHPATVLVAAAPLAFGAALSQENVTEISWPEGKVPDGAFASKNELFKGGRRAALAALQRNELILKSKITGPEQPASLSALLDEGKRAVTVRVDDVRGVAGFVLPGDRVDVILIRTINEGGKQESISDVLLQHVKVLAVDQVINERKENPAVARAVTLELDTDQAQKVVLATNVGKLSLILRQAGENHPVAAKRVTEQDLARIEQPAPPPPPAPVAAPAPTPPKRSDSTVVSIIRNMKREEYTVMRSSN
jgi:pilus assembly protein CpaB